MKHYGYILFTEPYKLNIVGLRGKSTVPNQFDDEIHVFYTKLDGTWNYHIYKVTTDPGTYWLNNPAYEAGTAILAQGQYRDAYAMGLHRGMYEALVQVRPVTVIRDYDRDDFLDFYNGIVQTGNFGINIHRAEGQGTTKVIDKYSAGCQVFQNADDFRQFIALCDQHRKLHGNSFTYTLIDFRAMRRITWRRVITITTLVASATIAWFLSSFE